MKTYMRKPQEHQEIENVQELCRLCLNKPDGSVPIFKDDQDVCAAIAIRVMSCVGLEIKYDDCLPNMICINCFEELEKYYKFRRKCEVSYHKLKSHVLALKLKEHKGELLIEHNKGVEENPPEQVMVDVQEQKPELPSEQYESIENSTEKVVEMKEVQIPIQTEVNPDIGTFLSTILKELGILVKHDDGLVLQDHGITSFELETGNDEQLVLELVEEDNLAIAVDTEQCLQSGLDTKEESVDLINSKSKQTNRKGDSKTAGPWCAQCGRVFSSRSAAARHARVHSGARPHACHTCTRTFAQKAVLDRHLLVHLAVRPHACARCGASFTQRAALAAHARAHAPAARRALRLHRCAHCDKVFLYASGLSRHMITHSGRVYECSACDKQFKDRSSLLRHLRNFYHDKGHSSAKSSEK